MGHAFSTADRPRGSTTPTACPLADLPVELLLRVALWLPAPVDAQRLYQTSKSLRRRLAGHGWSFRAAWLLHNHPATALTQAARHDDAALLSTLLAAPGERPDLDAALAAAAAAGHAAAVAVLLASGGADPNAGLLPAAGAGHARVVRLLVRAGADPFQGSGVAVTAAAHGNHINALRELLGFESRFAPLNGHSGYVGEPAMALPSGEHGMALTGPLVHPLVVAARAGALPRVHELLGRAEWTDGPAPLPGLPPLYFDPKQRKEDMLMAASGAAGGMGHVEVVRRLWEAAEEVEEDCSLLQRMVLEAALKGAACRGRCETIRQLLEMGAQVWWALNEACWYGHPDVIPVLVAAGSKVTHTALSNAAEAGDIDVLQALLAAAGGQYRDWGRAVAVSQAAHVGHVEVVETLLHGWRDSDVKTEALSESLHAASQAGHVQVARVLLREKAAVTDLSTLVDVKESDNGAVWELVAGMPAVDTAAVELCETARHGRIRDVKRAVLAAAGRGAQVPGVVAALREAGKGRHVAVVRFLLEKGGPAVLADAANLLMHVGTGGLVYAGGHKIRDIWHIGWFS